METTIKKWGNSPALRLPAALLKAASLNLDQKVSITARGGKLIIEPLDSIEYQLEDLLSGISPANLHDEVDTGRAVGNESL
ncbi:MAG: AbrB/MazE/SpoVT family DNA-binding domain-containing protein [Burkholderiales bacterium]|nr:AbrB/MazE/SpoVT family DNA-binding domain-containing protein [Burkholderiales bacterium]